MKTETVGEVQVGRGLNKGKVNEGKIAGQSGGRVKNMKKVNIVIRKVGNTPFSAWSEGMDFAALKGAVLLGQRKVGARFEAALYSLNNGDFCSVTGGMASIINPRDFPSYIAVEGCPWNFTPAQVKHVIHLIRKSTAENKKIALKRPDDQVMAEALRFSKKFAELMHKHRPQMTSGEVETIGMAVENSNDYGIRLPRSRNKASCIASYIAEMDEGDIVEGVDRKALIKKVKSMTMAEAMSLEYSVRHSMDEEVDQKDLFLLVDEDEGKQTATTRVGKAKPVKAVKGQ